MSETNLPEFGISKNVKQIGRTDVAGGGQVVVENGYAYVGHMDPPHGTSILDVRDPKHPKVIAEVEIPRGVHSHKVRVSGDVMLVNLERYQSKEKQPTGLKIFDISNREKPKEIAFFQTNGGVHRFTFDGRYAYISRASGRIYRAHRHDPGSQGSGAPRRSGTLVDARTMDRRRRDANLGRLRAPVPPPDQARRPALCQLLAWRVCYSGYRRYEPSKICQRF